MSAITNLNFLGSYGEFQMNNLVSRMVTKPIKVSVVRIEEVFQNTNPYKRTISGIIKDYVYVDQKRVIA